MVKNTIIKNMIDYNSGSYEKISIEVVGKHVDSHYLLLTYNKKDDEFDFTSEDKKWAVEQTSYIAGNLIEASRYEKALASGKVPDHKLVEGSSIDEKGNLIAYYGDGMHKARKEIFDSIKNKDKKCRSRLLKETSYERVDLIVTVPEDPMFNDKYSIKPLDEWIKKVDLIFEKIIVIFHKTIFVFSGQTGEYKFIDYSKE